MTSQESGLTWQTLAMFPANTLPHHQFLQEKLLPHGWWASVSVKTDGTFID